MAILLDAGKLGCWKREGLYVVAHYFCQCPNPPLGSRLTHQSLDSWGPQ